MFKKWTITGLVWFLVNAASAWGQTELLTNRTFDAGIDGWMVRGVGPGSISWDGSLGQPPGSLRFPDFNQVALTEACFSANVGIYTLSTDAYMETSGEHIECLINFYLYDTPDCSDYGSPIIDVDGVGLFPSVRGQNTWERLEFAFDIGPATLDQGGFRSLRPMLTKLSDLNEDDACLYDNVSLTYANLPRVPTVDPLGLGVLGTLLALAGLAVLRRRS